MAKLLWLTILCPIIHYSIAYQCYVHVCVGSTKTNNKTKISDSVPSVTAADCQGIFQLIKLMQGCLHVAATFTQFFMGN